MSVTKKEFEILNGTQIYEYTLSRGDITVKILNYGCIVRAFNVNTKKGDCDIVLGFKHAKDYVGTSVSTVVGRVANRIGGGAFTLNGKTYNLYKNNGNNTLHGGKEGFNNKVWQAEITGDYSVKLSYLSVDGEENFPANLKVSVEYSLTERNGLKIEYYATADGDTPVNLTNHSYFNLNGEGNGDILEHTMMINSDKITPVDAELIPHGDYMNVKNTPFDFNTPKAIGRDINADNEQLKFCGGYDVNFVKKDGSDLVAEIVGNLSGIKMQVYSTEKGVQFYTGNFLNSEKGKSGAYFKHYGFCLETQAFPNAVNCPTYPSIILKAGDIYHSVTEYVIVL